MALCEVPAPVLGAATVVIHLRSIHESGAHLSGSFW